MVNIITLFLVLFLIWSSLAFTSQVLSWPYIILGLIASAIISFTAWKIKIINKDTNFLFLNLGFYIHFIPLFFFSFFTSLCLILKFTTTSSEYTPITYYFPIEKQYNDEDLILLVTTINIIPGIFCIGVTKEDIVIHALDKRYFQESKLKEIYGNLHKINDDRLV